MALTDLEAIVKQERVATLYCDSTYNSSSGLCGAHTSP